jgi:hypothetical protein
MKREEVIWICALFEEDAHKFFVIQQFILE